MMKVSKMIFHKLKTFILKNGLFSSRIAGMMDFQGNLNSWNTSNVVDMSNMFEGNSFSNVSINEWDTSSVTDMSYMFYWAFRFTIDISSWNVSSVTDMSSMFDSAMSFNHDISSWDVSSVEYMPNMFYNSKIFNQDLSSWNVSNVIKCRRFSEKRNYADTVEWNLPKPIFTNCSPD